jgi:hypothetical protein
MKIKIFNFPQTQLNHTSSFSTKNILTTNNDPSNSLFLMNYELLNISQLKQKDIVDNMKRILNCLEAFKINQKEYIDNLQNSIDSLLFGEYHVSNNKHNTYEELETILDEVSPSYSFKLAFESLDKKIFKKSLPELINIMFYLINLRKVYMNL